MNNSETPTGANGKKENKEIKVSYVNEDFDEKWDVEICGFGFDMEADTVRYFHDQKSDEYFGLDSPEKQEEIRREALRLGKLKLVQADREKVQKGIDKEEMEEGKSIKTGNKNEKNAKAYDRERQKASQQSQNRTQIANAKVERERNSANKESDGR